MAGGSGVGVELASDAVQAEAAGAEDEVTSEGSEDRARRPLDARLVVLGLTALLAVPLVVALAVQWEPRWFPLTDMAEYELNVRDVGTTHPPDLGLPGRIFGYGDRGSHPGPIGFYLLWPLYFLFGSDGWSLQASSAGLVLLASGLGVWLGHRRGGWTFALAVAATLALLLRAYGGTILLEAWNPHLPLLWWVAFLLAVWSVLCRDLVAIPAAVLIGNVCLQTHISYVPLVGGLGVLTAAVLASRLRQAYRARDDDPATWRRLRAWTGGSAGLLVVLWVPPLIEHVTHTPGNLSVIRHNFTNPPDDRVPFGDAFTLWLDHFDLTTILGADIKPPFPYANVASDRIGLVVLALWAAAAVLAWRRGDPALRRLHLVIGVAIGLGLLGMSRILGVPWPYLTYWAWGTTALMALATVWTGVSVAFLARVGSSAASDGGTDGDGSTTPAVVGAPRWPRPTAVALGVATVLLVGLFAVDATDVEMDQAERSWTLSQVVGPTVDRLAEGPAGCDDDRCRVLISWTDDTSALGAQALGLLVALEREGVDARMLSGMELHVRSHRVTRRADADVEVHLAVDSPAIAEWRGRDGAEMVASARPRDPSEAEPIAVFLVTPDRSGTDRPQREAAERGL